MKKLAFAVLLIFACCLNSCNNSATQGGMTEKAKKNLATAQAVVKMFESGDYSKTGDYIAADAVDHSGEGGRDVKGVDSIRAEFEQMSKMMSNFKNEVVKEIADDDYSFQWLKETSTMKQDAMGMKAGSTNTFNAIEVSKFNADSKISDHWSFISSNDMMKMMPQMPMDTAMKKK